MAYILERLHQIDQTPYHRLNQNYCMASLMHKDPPDRDLIEWAVREEEWDFITTCLGTGVIHSEFLPAKLANESDSNIRNLYSYARRRDKTMVQWVFETSKKGSLSDKPMYIGSGYTERRNLRSEFQESRAAPDPLSPKPPLSVADQRWTKPSKPKEGNHGISSFFHGLRRKNSKERPPMELGEPGPSSPGLHLSPTSSIDDSFQSPHHVRSAPYGSSLDRSPII